jgi:hypothetical protein
MIGIDITPILLTIFFVLLLGAGGQLGLTLTFIGACVAATGAFIAIPFGGVAIITGLLSDKILPFLFP